MPPVRVDPQVVLRLDASHLTLVAGMSPVRDDGRPDAAQLAPMALAACQFELSDGAWRWNTAAAGTDRAAPVWRCTR